MKVIHGVPHVLKHAFVWHEQVTVLEPFLATKWERNSEWNGLLTLIGHILSFQINPSGLDMINIWLKKKKTCS